MAIVLMLSEKFGLKALAKDSEYLILFSFNCVVQEMLEYLALVAVLPPLSLADLLVAGGVAGHQPAIQLFWTVTQTQLGLALNSGFSRVVFLICLLTNCSVYKQPPPRPHLAELSAWSSVRR